MTSSPSNRTIGWGSPGLGLASGSPGDEVSEVSMKRAARLILLGYVAAGLVGLALERAGVYECACDPDCWCKRPGLSVFRWVFPRFHKGEGARWRVGHKAD